ncbi:MAG: hypothetical protein Q9170_006968 [Blastenia crenularia]
MAIEALDLVKNECAATRDSRASSHTLFSVENVDTQDVLTNFAPVAAQYFQKEEERKLRLSKHLPMTADLRQILDRLKSRQKKPSTARAVLPWPIGKSERHNIDELKRLAKFHFPCRSEIMTFITDFKESSAHTWKCRLSEITKHMSTKPNDVQVRWIHAPLGLGPLHSTIEDLFLHKGLPGRPFENLGRSGWPYAQIEVLNFCDRHHFQNLRDVYHFLHDSPALTEELNQECWMGFEPKWKTDGKGVIDDLEWRTTHLGLKEDWKSLPDYWTACTSDIPWQISESLSAPVYGPLDGLHPTLWQSDKQALHKHNFFGSAQVVRDPFRCFHRGDGFLLTLSPMRGVNYLDRNFKRHLEEPGNAIFDNDVASAIAFVRRQFEDTGTQKWHRATVEWLVVHLLTEIGTTPHIWRQGCNAPSLEGAYQAVLQQFKRRRDEHFNKKDRDEPAGLIKDMLVCKDELRRMTIMCKRQERVFEKLNSDVGKFETEDLEQGKQADHELEASAPEKAQFALGRAQRQTEAFELLFQDICMSLDEVYDLRSIQQRQSGMITDGQSRSLVLMTLVQLVFIPFVALCGYWGMNMSDIRQTSMDQRDFWRICASVVLAVGFAAKRASETRASEDGSDE